MRLLRLVAPHFVAGVLVDERGLVVEAAPIVGYSVGWTGANLRKYAARRGWSAAYLSAST